MTYNSVTFPIIGNLYRCKINHQCYLLKELHTTPEGTINGYKLKPKNVNIITGQTILILEFDVTTLAPYDEKLWFTKVLLEGEERGGVYLLYREPQFFDLFEAQPPLPPEHL